MEGSVKDSNLSNTAEHPIGCVKIMHLRPRAFWISCLRGQEISGRLILGRKGLWSVSLSACMVVLISHL